ncbi:hypothetical protein M0804_004491 [Polistes exclamans]|nr:hypothetical protein M0804_004491 [Polistes exclamans]
MKERLMHCNRTAADEHLPDLTPVSIMNDSVSGLWLTGHYCCNGKLGTGTLAIGVGIKKEKERYIRFSIKAYLSERKTKATGSPWKLPFVANSMPPPSPEPLPPSAPPPPPLT